MKNIIKYGLLSLVAAAGVSCESFLNEKVVSGVSYDYLETKTGIETAVNGVYSTMRWYVGGERYYCLPSMAWIMSGKGPMAVIRMLSINTAIS